MHPLFLLTALGHASLVTPTSVCGPFAVLVPPRQPAAAPARTSTATTARDAGLLIAASSIIELVGKGPGLPVVADPGPDAGQPARLEYQEHDDQYAVEHRLQLVGVRRIGRRRTDERHERRYPTGQPGRQAVKEAAHDRTRESAGTADQHHRDVLHRQQEVERTGVEEAADGVEQGTGAAGVER